MNFVAGGDVPNQGRYIGSNWERTHGSGLLSYAREDEESRRRELALATTLAIRLDRDMSVLKERFASLEKESRSQQSQILELNRKLYLLEAEKKKQSDITAREEVGKKRSRVVSLEVDGEDETKETGSEQTNKEVWVPVTTTQLVIKTAKQTTSGKNSGVLGEKKEWKCWLCETQHANHYSHFKTEEHFNELMEHYRSKKINAIYCSGKGCRKTLQKNVVRAEHPAEPATFDIGNAFVCLTCGGLRASQ